MSAPPGDDRPTAALRDYVALARPDHWVKHVFIVPGLVLAMILLRPERAPAVKDVLLGFIAAALVASANYVLNEWLDASTDRHHPRKSRRPAVQKRLSQTLVYLEYTGLLVCGLALANAVDRLFLIASIGFAISGAVYNVGPVRFKDVPVLDVLTESANNPIRLILGWAMVDGATLPPSTLLLSYWMGGAFLMAVKRFAEFRSVSAQDPAALVRYRKSFAGYSENSLLISAFIYALMASFFLAIFLVKYRIEYLLAFPLFAALFGLYLAIGLRRESAAESPEGLFRETRLLLTVAVLVAVLALLSWIDVPVLEQLTSPHYIVLPWGGG